MLNYSLSREARQDIDEILIYIAADSVNAAVSFNDRLENVFLLLGDNPKAGRERPDLSRGLRSFPLGNYLIFYRVRTDDVTISRVIHCARDIQEIVN